MAIQFARVEIIGRSGGRNALQKSAYNSRSKVEMERAALLKAAYNSRGKTIGKGKVYNFSNRSDSEHHEVILPDHVDRKFSNVSRLMNAVEIAERRKDSQLLKEVVIALPKEEKVGLEGRIEISRRFIEKMGWTKEGLGVQLDIHKPHEDKDKNYHAHILVTTRRFRKDGLGLENRKARDLNPVFKSSKGSSFVIREEEMISDKFREVQEEYFREKGLDIKVDLLSENPQKHLGPRRFRTAEAAKIISINKEKSMRSVLHHKSSAIDIVKAFTSRKLVFSKGDMKYFMEREGIHNDGLLDSIFKLKEVRELRYYLDSSKEYRMSKKYVVKDQWEQVDRGMRNASKINSFKMKEMEYVLIGVDSYSKSYQLSPEQRRVYRDIAIDRRGLRILRGVAGSGKSRILGALHDLYKLHVRVIGIAPTNKAVNELRDRYFGEIDTVAGFLWKMEKSRMNLKRGSLVILDEGSMVSNNSYDRLLSICQSKGLRLIISGDERQLSSIGRGGIFDRIINEFDSVKLDRIVRQRSSEDIRVAEHLANGRVDLAVNRLSDMNRLIFEDNERGSILRLIKDWAHDKSSIRDRLIIASRNSEVDLFNISIHQVVLDSQRMSGGIRGIYKKEYLDSKEGKVVRSEDYVLGERIVFTGTRKDLGIYNGDFGEVVKIDKNLLVVKIDRGDAIIRFNPKNFGDFKYGYASTVYKSQGASVERVFIYHEGYGNRKNSYVALTRHRDMVRVYCNSKTTKNNFELTNQLGSDREFCMVKNYRLPNLYEDRLEELRRHGGKLAKYQTIVLKGVRAVRNWYSDFANVENAPNFQSNQVKVLDSKLEKNLQSDSLKEIKLDDKRGLEIIKDLAKAVPEAEIQKDKNISNIKSQIRDQIKIEQKNKPAQKAQLDDLREIRALAKDNITNISREIFGSENKELSTGSVLKFGSKGKVAIHLEGERKGLWYDFSKSEGGDAIKLVQKQFGFDFKESVKYLKERYGKTDSKIEFADRSEGKSFKVRNLEAKKEYKEQIEKINQAKIEKIEKDKIKLEGIYQKTRELDIISKSYFKGRGIEQIESLDIRSGKSYDKRTGQYYKSIVAFARDKEGVITGSQFTYIKKEGEFASKADVVMAKRSFGKISGSFVSLGDNRLKNKEGKSEGITYISEGIESGLSVKESGIKGKFISSLGIGNIKNYDVSLGEKIVIICDNDGVNHKTERVIENSKKILETKGAVVVLAKPQESEYDYNDVLTKSQDTSGKELIQKDLHRSIEKLEDRHLAFEAIGKGIDRNLFLVLDLKKLNPEYSFVELRDKVAKGGKYYGEDITNVVNKEVRREFSQYSRALIDQNRELGRGDSLVSLGRIVLEEHKIVNNLKESYPEIMKSVSSARNNNSEIGLKEVEQLSTSLDKYIEHSFERKNLGLDILEERGLIGLNLESEELCKSGLENKIIKDLTMIERGDREYEVRDFQGGIARDRGEYLDSLLKDDDAQSMIENQKIMELMEQHQKHHELSLSISR